MPLLMISTGFFLVGLIILILVVSYKDNSLDESLKSSIFLIGMLFIIIGAYNIFY